MVGQQRTSVGVRALLLACAVLVAGGVLAMHALVTTALASPAGGDAAGPETSALAAHAAHAAHVVHDVEAAGSGATETDAGGHGVHDGLLDVCLALVVALGLVLAGAVLRAGTRIPTIDRVDHVARQLRARSVARSAPDLHALSVLRC